MPRADDSDHTDDHTELMALAVRLARGAGSLTVRLRADGRADGRGDGRPDGGGDGGADGGAEGRADGGGDGGSLGVAVKSSPTDVVTDVDRASERWLADELARLRPDDGLLGEEARTVPAAAGCAGWSIPSTAP